ncbi:unnamed protein product, partial [Laminaria digitata]
MTDTLQDLGVEVRFATRARGLERRNERWVVHTRKGEVHAHSVIANMLPQNLQGLLQPAQVNCAQLVQTAERVETGWGAAMLYLVVAPPPGAAQDALHLELVADPSQPFIEGNHIFCSISGAHDEGRAPTGLRTMTVSTHIPLADVRTRSPEAQASYYAQVRAAMKHNLAGLAPEWLEDLRFEMPASPRTFERFTGRYAGIVGGVPRRAGLNN